jgi:hypothetical protein
MSRDTNAIVDLEARFWKTMVDKDAKLAKTMIAAECLVAGPSGTMKLDPEKYEAMTEDGNWELDTFAFNDMKVIFPSDTVAVVAYKVRQTGALGGEKMDMTCADSSTWVRQGGAWKCVLHTETILNQ